MDLLQFDLMSDKLGYQTNIYVLLPGCTREGISPEGVLYLLHGGSGHGTDWIRNSNVERYAAPYNFAVIMPEVDGSCFYADMKHGYPYFQYVTEEVPDMMETLLPVLKGVKRYVAGYSMGGYGAFKCAFCKPEFYEAAANLSGASFTMKLFENLDREGQRELVECNWGSLEELKDSESDSRYWIDHAVRTGQKLPRLFAATGTEDYSYPMAVDYVAYAKEKGIEIRFEDMPGGHEWNVWDAMIKRFIEDCASGTEIF